jgi:hypothetical protein
MERLTFEALKLKFKALTGNNLQLQGGIVNYKENEYSLAYSRDGVAYYDDDIPRGRYTLQGKVGDQDTASTLNAKFLSPGRKIVLIQKLQDGAFILHGIYSYSGKLEVLYHPGEDGVERKIYRAVLRTV